MRKLATVAVLLFASSSVFGIDIHMPYTPYGPIYGPGGSPSYSTGIPYYNRAIPGQPTMVSPPSGSKNVPGDYVRNPDGSLRKSTTIKLPGQPSTYSPPPVLRPGTSYRPIGTW